MFTSHYILEIITYCTLVRNFQAIKILTLHEKLYLPGPILSWRAQKDQVNITFTSTFWLKKTVFPITEKLKTRTFQQPVSIIFPSTFCLKKIPYFPSLKNSKQQHFSNQQYHVFPNFCLKKKTAFPIPEKLKTRTF